MTRFMAALFIGHREAIPHDGSRHAIADGYLRHREDAGAHPDDDRLAADLAVSLRKAEEASAVRDAGLDAWHARQQREGGAS